MKIRYRILIILLLITLTPQIILNQLYASTLEKQMISKINQSADHEGEALRQLMSNTLSDNEQLVLSMVRNIPYVFGEDATINQEAMNLLLRVSQESTGNTPNFFIGTESGDMFIFPESSLPDGYDPRVRNWYQQAMLTKNQVNWDGPYIDQGTKQLVITVSKYFKYQSTEGVVGIDVVLSNLRGVLANPELDQYGETFLTDALGNIVIHSNPSFEGFNLRLSKYAADGLTRDLAEGSYDGKTYKYFISKISESLFAITAVKQSAIEAGISSELWRSRTVPFIFIVLTVIVAIWLSKTMTSPIDKLIKAFRVSEIGKVPVHVDVSGKDELAQLANEFNHMSDNLLSAHQEMTALYEELSASEETLQDQYDELRHNRDQIMKSEHRYRTIFELSNEGLWEIDEQRNLRLLTPNWFKNFFYQVDDIEAKDWLALVHPGDKARFEATSRSHIHDETPYIHEIYRVRDVFGQYRFIETKGKKMTLSDGQQGFTIVGSHLDVTERKRNEEEILKMAYFDAVTGLANRQNFERELEQSLSHHDYGTIIYLDIANFKAINETYGYQYGDKILEDMKARLLDQFAGKFCARIAGDEFAVIIEGHIEESSLQALLNIFSVSSCCSLDVDGLTLKYEIHAVSCKFPNEGKTVDEIYLSMFTKLKQAKNLTKTNVFDFRPLSDGIMKGE